MCWDPALAAGRHRGVGLHALVGVLEIGSTDLPFSGSPLTLIVVSLPVMAIWSQQFSSVDLGLLITSVAGVVVQAGSTAIE